MNLAGELAVNRWNTEVFISFEPSSIALIPHVPVKTGTGTTWQPQAARPVQVFRVIRQGTGLNPMTPGTVRASDGRQRRVEFQLLGKYDAVMGLYDSWTDSDGVRWEVADLVPDNQYEIRAQVVRLGEI